MCSACVCSACVVRACVVRACVVRVFVCFSVLYFMQIVSFGRTVLYMCIEHPI